MKPTSPERVMIFMVLVRLTSLTVILLQVWMMTIWLRPLTVMVTTLQRTLTMKTSVLPRDMRKMPRMDSTGLGIGWSSSSLS